MIEKQSEQLLDLINSDLEFFHDKNDKTFVTFSVNNHKETWEIKSEKFHQFLAKLFWEKHNKPIGANGIKEALMILESKALYEGECHQVFLRVGNHGNKTYIDLCNDLWQVIEISDSDWKILDNSPVKFRRTDGMQPLPMPKKDIGDIELLWKYINIPKNKETKLLILAYMLECFRVETPFPILTLIGLQGSAKSFTQSKLKDLIDPHNVNLRSAPIKPDDLPVNASNNYLVSFNNVSVLKNSLQDTLCCVSTGGGFSTRLLFTNDKEYVSDTMRPIIMNGIDNFITRPDLLDRSIVIDLPNIKDTERKSEAEINKAFIKDREKIFTGLLDLLVKTLNKIPNTKINKLPRLADFAILGTALEKVLDYGNGSFLKTYRSNFRASIESTIDASPIISALVELMRSEKVWAGRYIDLLDKLILKFPPNYRTQYPENAKEMASLVKRYIPMLQILGITITEIEPRKEDGRHIEIQYDLQLVQDDQCDKHISTSKIEPVCPAHTVDKTEIMRIVDEYKRECNLV